MRSLLAPLVLGLVLSLAAVFGVQWSLFGTAVHTLMEDYIAEELAHDADEVFSSLSILQDGRATLALTHFDPPFISPYSGRYFQIMSERTIDLRSPSLADMSLAMAPVERGERRVTHIAGPGDQALLLSTTGYELGERRITIGVAGDLKPIQAQLDRLIARYTQGSVAMFALLVVVQIGIVRLAIAPLRRAQADVSRLERGEIDQLDEQVPAEMLPLVREFNRLVTLFAGRLQRSRESLGNMAHALKAPLAVLTHMAGGDLKQRDPELSRQMEEQLGMLQERISSELRRARIAGGRAAGRSLDLAAEIQTLAATLRKLYADRNMEISCRVDPGARFRGDREDLLELCGNLLDNACKWAQSRVSISVRRGKELVLAVEDDGPGCSPEGQRRIARRGVRLDESTEGHGLGLAIADSIASSYGAQLRFGRSQALGGFEATVTFPAR